VLIKLDTDGNDGNILKANAELIAQDTPTLFFEWEPRFVSAAGGIGATDVFDVLALLGYGSAIVFAMSGELLLRVRTDDSETLADLCRYADTSDHYFDVCTVHEGDAALEAKILDGERRVMSR
jgi:hypothetical protein